MGCGPSSQAGGQMMPLVAQEPPARAAWAQLVSDKDGFAFKVQPSALDAEHTTVKSATGESLALVKTVENKHKGAVQWTLQSLDKEAMFTVTAGATSGTFFVTDVTWGGVVATIQKKYRNSESEIEVFADDKVGEEDARLLTSFGRAHTLRIINPDGEVVARSRKGTRFVEVAKGVDTVFILCLYLVREKLDHISETFH